MPGVDQVGAPPMGGPCLCAADVTLTESIEALLPKSGRETIPALPFFENSLDKVLDLDAIENEEPTELSLLSDATEDSLEYLEHFSPPPRERRVSPK